MDEFYQGDDPEKRYLAVAYRAADSILRSLKHLPSAFGGELMALLTIDTLWGLCLLAAGWFLATVISGPIGLAVNLILMAYGLYSAWDTIEQTYSQLKDWFWGFYRARSDIDLEEAGAHFAKGFAKGGVFLIELVFTHRALRFASSRLVQRFPPPDKLRLRFEEERRKASERQSERKDTRKAQAEPEPTPRERGTLRKLETLGRTYGGLELGQQSAQLIRETSADVGVVMAVLGVAAAGAIVLSVAALSEERKERR